MAAVDKLITLYNQLETYMLIEIAQRLTTYDGVSGSLEWYLDKLNEMGALNENNVRLIAKLAKLTTEEVKKILHDAQFDDIKKSIVDEAHRNGSAIASYDDLKTNQIFNLILAQAQADMEGKLKLINTKALESAKEAYMKCLNKAFVSTASGVMSYNQAIDQGIKEMVHNGLKGATYRRNNGRLVNYSIESVVRRDTLTSVAHLQNDTNMEAVKELGCEYVEVTSHIGARTSNTNPIANHFGWQGQVYKLVGQEPTYPNFYEMTGYGDIEGLGGVNCRHRFYPFFPGISQPSAIQYSAEENDMVYKATQHQRKLERDMRTLKKELAVNKAIGNDDNVKEYNRLIKEKSKEIDDFCDKNGLKRDYQRERISEQIAKYPSREEPKKMAYYASENNVSEWRQKYRKIKNKKMTKEEIDSVNELKEELTNSGINIVDFSKLKNTSIAKPLFNTLIKLQNQYGITFSRIKISELVDSNNIVPAQVSDKTTLEIDEMYINSIEINNGINNYLKERGIIPKKAKPMKYIVTHEFAHLKYPFQNDGIEQLFNSKRTEDLVSSNAKKESDEFVADYWASYHLKLIDENDIVKMLEELLNERWE